jgi:EAL domain-containing protein (putative c-di-GMP-specific phosphodiesterase class I)
MYRAKESGKARYEIFDQEMHVRNMNLLQVETDLRHAVERNEFEVVYQPIVDLDTGGVSEFEALIRWRHPVHGLVGPNEFINVAEETGLIIPIGRWILDEACRQVVEWQRRFDLDLSISVNLSAKQLMHPALTSEVNDVLTETGLRPSNLKLEVTESTVMEHSEKSLKVLSDLDRLGVALSTDDFGTGYSSLSYLQKFPFERLKIDRSFVKVMDDDAKSGAIVKTILMLGENLGIEVVAEGIETAAQLDKLRQLGCRAGQGYLFSRPVDRESIEAFLESGANIFTDQSDLQPHTLGSMIELADVQ